MRHKPEYTLSLLLWAGLMLIGCAQKDSPVGSNLAPGLAQEAPKEMFLPPQDVRFYRTSVTTGASTLLYLGYNQGYYANTLLKFNPFGSLPDSFLMDSLKVKLVLDSVLIAGTGAMTASAFLVNYQQSWSEIGATWDNFNTDSLQLGSSFAALEILPTAVDSDTVVFSLPAPDSLIRSWTSAGSGGKTLQFNNGIYLAAATGQDYMLRFGSAEHPITSHRPQLQMYLQNYDTTVTHGGDPVDTVLFVNAVGDAFIAKDSTVFSPEDDSLTLLGNGAAYRTLMRFNIDSAFTAHYGMAVQRAELILRSDTTNALAFDYINGAYGLPLADLSWLPDSSGSPGSPANAATLPVSLPAVSPYVPTTGILALNVTTMVNDWVIHPGTHHGLMVHSANEYFSVARLPFWGSNAPSDSLRPVLRIVYVQGGGYQ